MSRHAMHGWAAFSRESAGGGAFRHQRDSSSGWLHTLFFWIDRSRQRRQLGEMADLNDNLLRDIGLTREEARREAEKPFWR